MSFFTKKDKEDTREDFGLKMYSIFDRMGANFQTPFFARSDAEAVRHFMFLLHDPRSRIYVFQEDFELFKIGSFDETSGILIADTGLTAIVSGRDLMLTGDPAHKRLHDFFHLPNLDLMKGGKDAENTDNHPGQ